MAYTNKEFSSLLCGKILNIPLPFFPLYFKNFNGLPVLYHFTQKLQYEPVYSVVLKPILAAIFKYIPMIHLLRNAGDLCHDGHCESYKNVINTFCLTEKGIAITLANDSCELGILESIRGQIDNFDNYYANIFNANRLHDPNIFCITNRESERKYVFCHTARLVRFKRHELLLAALRLLNNGYAFRGLVLSSGIAERRDSKSYEYQLEQKIKSSGITIRTRISPQEVNFFLNQSNMGVILSDGEGACAAVGEYLLAGLPVLTIDGARGGRNDFLKEYNAFFCKADADSVAEGIENILRREPNRQHIRDKFARHCLPSSYWELQNIAKSIALKSDQMVGRVNEKYIHRLMTYTSLLDVGIETADLMKICQYLVMHMDGVVLETNLSSNAGIRIFLRGVNGIDDENGVDVTSVGCALWSSNLEEAPELCFRKQGEEECCVISLEHSGAFYCELDGVIVSFVVHKNSPAIVGA